MIPADIVKYVLMNKVKLKNFGEADNLEKFIAHYRLEKFLRILGPTLAWTRVTKNQL